MRHFRNAIKRVANNYRSVPFAQSNYVAVLLGSQSRMNMDYRSVLLIMALLMAAATSVVAQDPISE